MARFYLTILFLGCSLLLLSCGESSTDPDDFYENLATDGGAGLGGTTGNSGAGGSPGTGGGGGSGGSGGSETGGSGGTDGGSAIDGGNTGGTGGESGMDGSSGTGTDASTDQCPDDPDKTEPGVCGCGVPDVDTDGDATLDCEDECPDDKDFTVAPDCGCPSDPKQAGAKCDDGYCAAANKCDGKGNCGTPADCPPNAKCTHKADSGHDYWFCPAGTGGWTWTASDKACKDVGLYLVKIEKAAENTFVNTNRTEHMWVGLKDVAGNNKFKWVVDNIAPTYTNWNPGEPSNTYQGKAQDCVFMGYVHEQGWSAAKWTDGVCSNKLGYVCEGDW